MRSTVPGHDAFATREPLRKARVRSLRWRPSPRRFLTQLVAWTVAPLAAVFTSLPAAEPPPTDAAALADWQAMRFGMFIHWGPVSLKGTEIGWSRGAGVPVKQYDLLYREFNPAKFSAAEWVAVAKAAGMKYLVFTSKHHDGFCLWDSRHTDYDIMSTPFKRDVLRELAEACRREGILFGLYYSICDWWHPDYPLGSPGGKSRKPAPHMDRYTAYLKGQVAELILNYGPLGVLWFDGEWEEPWDETRGRDLYTYCRTLQPSLLVNNRVSKARDGMAGTSKPGLFAGDFDTPEQQLGRFNLDRPWESCVSLCWQWAWSPGHGMKSLAECLRTLITCAGGDGNLLLNVGPMPDGRIEPRQVERLQEIGAWLATHGEAIYGTRGGPFKPGNWGASTRQGDTLYLHVFEWPVTDVLRLPPLPRNVLSSRVLTGGDLEVRQSNERLSLRVPAADRQPIATVIALKLDGSAMDIPPLRTARRSLAEGKAATASNTFPDRQVFAPANAVDGDETTRWAPAPGSSGAFLEVDLGEPTEFSQAVIQEWHDALGRVRDFQIAVFDGASWRKVQKGTLSGGRAEVRFNPVTARKVRLFIAHARVGFAIAEFELHP
ncbi:MAG: alpha-L-fucosidase [Verrucomicrobiales bacterium]|nr:alpha-L-fucosidase [Verrucomicrobiales bacterium]